jgi:uncharacterized phage infection (PIP) family protein YhgE
MTIEELLDELHSIESALRTPEVQLFVREQDEKTRKRFVTQLNKISTLINRLENDQLKEVAGKLDELNDDLTAGIENIKKRIKELNDAIAVINTISKFLGVAAKVVALVA